MATAGVLVRRVTAPDDPAIPVFGRLQTRTFPEPELLIPAAYLPRMITAATPERCNFLVVAEQEGRVVGGAVFHFFAKPNTGFSSFLTVAPEVRGQGVARALHEARFAALDAAGSEPVHGVFIDVTAPERLSAAQRDRERAVEADPVTRRQIFHRLGFRQVDVAYEQPAEGSGGVPITTMDLLFCARSQADQVKTDLVVETMKAYWAPWLGTGSAHRNADELRHRCGGEYVALLPAYKDRG